MSADTSSSLPLVHSTIRGFMDKRASPGLPDITLLLVLPYLSCNTPTTAAAAATASLPTLPPVCVRSRDIVVSAITSNLHSINMTPDIRPQVVDGLKKAFYNAGRDTLIQMLRIEIETNAVWSISFVDSDELIFKTWIDDVKANLENTEIPLLRSKMPLNQLTQYDQWMSSIKTIASAYLRAGLDLTNKSNLLLASNSPHMSSIVSYVSNNFNGSMLDAIVNVFLAPWLMLVYVDMFAMDERFNIHTQVYAYKLLIDMSATAVGKLANTYDAASQSSGQPAMLISIVSSLGNMVYTSTLNVDKEATEVINEAADNRKKSMQLRAIDDEMRKRLGRSMDLQLRYQILEEDVLKEKQLMMLWIASLITFTLSSALLILRDKLTPFLLLAATTFGVMLITLLVPMIIRKFQGGTI